MARRFIRTSHAMVKPRKPRTGVGQRETGGVKHCGPGWEYSKRVNLFMPLWMRLDNNQRGSRLGPRARGIYSPLFKAPQ